MAVVLYVRHIDCEMLVVALKDGVKKFFGHSSEIRRIFDWIGRDALAKVRLIFSERIAHLQGLVGRKWCLRVQRLKEEILLLLERTIL